ncbi:MAG: ATP-dependent DNA helicase RecG [Anaerolineae bacterium]|nr:ATP-dependent DNA helicase RecG [Anaerolineae bacterium]
MLSSIEKIRKFLKLEADRGFDNKAVLGGLNKVVPAWQTEANIQKVETNLVQEVVSRLGSYNILDVPARQETINYLLEVLQDYQPENHEANLDEAPESSREKTNSQPIDRQSQKPRQNFQDRNNQRTGNYRRENNAPSLGLDAPLTVVSGIGHSFAQKLSTLGLQTLNDLLFYFPRRYDDYTQLKPINRLQYAEEVTVIGTVQSVQKRNVRGGSLQVVEAVITDGTGFLRLSWFNQPWVADQLKENSQVVISGKIDLYLGRMVINSPEWEYLEKEHLHTHRIVPVYPLTAHLTQRWLRRILYQAVHFWAPRLTDHLTPEIRNSAQVIDLASAVLQVHFPDNTKKLKDAQERLAFDEIFLLQLGVLNQKRNWDSASAQVFNIGDDWFETFYSRLPFELTHAQKKAIQEIREDLKTGHPMNRLLQGDVGSGKTMVAAAAIAMITGQGAQAAFMAPTSILAEQHYRSLLKLFCEGENPILPASGVRLLVGYTPESERRDILEGLQNGSVSLLIGTHALIEDPVSFNNLKLVVVDEQHRFGVSQRSALRNKGVNPHLLVMTATPIPRSLALTVYGDLELSVMDEMPAGRQPIETFVLSPSERERAYNLIRNQVQNGRQAFIIFPLIEKGEREEIKAAVDEHEKLQKEIFPNLSIGLLHGRLRADEKDAVMARFKSGEHQILVSTSVVEVGVDVPNATVMMIEGANRLGLAQLHQFRGRVGRGSEKSFCLLVPETSDAIENERLTAMSETNDGFILAERDLQQRGPGDFLGTRQSGYVDLKMANMSDVRLIEKARNEAKKLFGLDPELSLPQHENLRNMFNRFWTSGRGDIS